MSMHPYIKLRRRHAPSSSLAPRPAQTHALRHVSRHVHGPVHGPAHDSVHNPSLMTSPRPPGAPNTASPRYTLRSFLVLGVLLIALSVMAARAAWVQVWNKDFLQAQGQQRYQREVKINAVRGTLLDRHGVSLAVSTPVDSVWMHPREFAKGSASDGAQEKIALLIQYLGLSDAALQNKIKKNSHRAFVYLKRHLAPRTAARITALRLDGVYLQREYRRYYPLSATAAHLVGFTNVDGVGLEGLELMLDTQLHGRDGGKIEIRDLRGAPVESVAAQAVVNGTDIRLSIDARLQKIAYERLAQGVRDARGVGGTIVLMDIASGEVLAMASAPGFNPNNLQGYAPAVFRNRAVTDVFEPGSAIKTFAVGVALHAGLVALDTKVHTSPGKIQIGAHTIHDLDDFGTLTVAEVLVNSSNIGMIKIARKFPRGVLQATLAELGFGRSTSSGLPGEVGGRLPLGHLQPVEQVSMAFGYGMSVTALQLTRAYSTLANDGVLAPVTLLKRDNAQAGGRRVMSRQLARRLRGVMERVVTHGTAKRARIQRYRVAAKTGTVWKHKDGTYDKENYTATVVGFAPASAPRLVMTVVVDEPRGDEYYGGLVAAPIFRDVMARALRFLDVPPDDLPVQAAQNEYQNTHHLVHAQNHNRAYNHAVPPHEANTAQASHNSGARI